jgi:hypothetical protein
VAKVDEVKVAGAGADLTDIPTEYSGVLAANVVNVGSEFMEILSVNAIGQGILVAE